MADSLEAFLLALLPWSFVIKTLAIGIMGLHLNRYTVPTGPLGKRINIEFIDQTIMSALITAGVFILASRVDPAHVYSPMDTILLAGVSLWPLRTAWSHYAVYRTYLQIARGEM
jgi:hypothetical protein